GATTGHRSGGGVMSGPRGARGALDTGATAPAQADRIDSRKVAQAFGQALRTMRCEQGVTQEGLADGAGIDRTYPSLLERGRRHPTLTMLLRLARALAVEPAELVNRTVRQLRAWSAQR